MIITQSKIHPNSELIESELADGYTRRISSFLDSEYSLYGNVVISHSIVNGSKTFVLSTPRNRTLISSCLVAECSKLHDIAKFVLSTLPSHNTILTVLRHKKQPRPSSNFDFFL